MYSVQEERIEIPIKIALESTKDFNIGLKNGNNLTAEFGSTQIVHTDNYEDLYNKPKIEGNTLIGDKTFTELGLNYITEQDIDDIIYGGE